MTSKEEQDSRIRGNGMRIIPAIDIIEGKCVRLTKGDYGTKKIYSDNPLEMAKAFEGRGARYLHLVDLDGAKSDRIVNYKILEVIASKTSLQIDFGGGLKSDADVRIAFESGASQITGGSVAVKDPALFKSWLHRYGQEKIILGADVNDEKISITGWLETSEESVVPFIQKYREAGVQYIICTDIAKDGMLQGPSFGLYKNILRELKNDPSATDIKFIASGGISCMDDLHRLAELGCEGAIVGKWMYEAPSAFGISPEGGEGKGS